MNYIAIFISSIQQHILEAFTMGADESKAKILFANARIVDGTGRYVKRGHVGIEGESIVRVEEDIDIPSYQGWNIIDVSGKTILPGLIDCHVHLLLDSSANPIVSAHQESRPLLALKGAINAKKTLESGVTTVRDMGGVDHVELVLRDAIRSTLIPGPRVLCVGRVITMTGGHLWPIGIEADGPDGVRKAVRSEVKAGVDEIKFMSTGGVMTSGGELGSSQLTEDELRSGIEEAHRLGKKTSTHAQGRDGIKNALRAGIDCIEHGIGLDDEAIEMMLVRNVQLTPTFTAQHLIRTRGKEAGIPEFAVRRAEEIEEVQVESIQKAKRAGIAIAMRKRWQSAIPLGRPAKPQDHAAAAVFLASDDADYITGITVPVDGGWVVSR
jgi:imidazolonepropionase-like amidohydrolase